MAFAIVPRTAPCDVDVMEAWRQVLISEIRADYREVDRSIALARAVA